MTCAYEPDLDESRSARTGDSCGTGSASTRLEHDSVREPCSRRAVPLALRLA